MALGPELIVNGDFSNGDTGWNISGTWALDGEAVRGTNSAGLTQFYQSDVLTDFTKDYQVQFEVIEVSGGWCTIEFNNAGLSEQFNSTGVKTVTLNSVGGNGSVTIRGGAFYGLIDNVSVKEVLPTTTVEVEWIDSVSVAATGNKIYRDTVPSTGEVEIADIANGIQIYQDATAETGTEYKYEVQAHDGAGGETTLETVGVNTQFITTA